MTTPPPPSSNPTDFQASAAAAAARIFSPSSAAGEQKSPGEVLAQSLLDGPKIDTAVRAFLSLVAARSLTATRTDSSPTAAPAAGADVKCVFTRDGGKDPNMESLKCARALLKAINGLTLPEDDGDNDAPGGEEKEHDAEESPFERQVVRIVWNGLASKGHKVSKLLGRRALRYAYPLILDRVRRDRARAAPGPDDSILPAGVDHDCSAAFFEEFGVLLYPQTGSGRRTDGDGEGGGGDDDSALLWDADGGAAELRRRRDRRVQRGRDAAVAAETRARDTLSSAMISRPGESSVTIEEISEEDPGSNESSE